MPARSSAICIINSDPLFARLSLPKVIHLSYHMTAELHTQCQASNDFSPYGNFLSSIMYSYCVSVSGKHVFCITSFTNKLIAISGSKTMTLC